MTASISRLFGPDALELLDAFVRERVEAILREREAEKRWMTVEETGQYLGISPGAVRHRIARGSIPYTRQGRSLLIDRAALDRQLERHAR